MKTDIANIPTPCYIIDEGRLEENLKKLASIQEQAGCKILLALKAFAPFSLFPLMRRYLSGVAASSIDEARLGFEEFGKEIHACAPAYRPEDFEEMASYCSHIVFNSISQWQQFKSCIESGFSPVSCGIRINPEHSEVEYPIYDPCAPFSRLGMTLKQISNSDLTGIKGLHFHTLCEMNADALERTLKAVESRFRPLLAQLEWVNLGGGHHITRENYDADHLCHLIHDLKARYNLNVYLEPGEAVALNAGELASSVLDIINNEMDIAILDTSAAAHMPDVLEMPYRPEISGAGKADKYPYRYRLGGLSCLAGDVIGDYSFDKPLSVGTRLFFKDMAHYTMVKNNTFNGVRLPSIVVKKRNGEMWIVREFGYSDYRNRLS